MENQTKQSRSETVESQVQKTDIASKIDQNSRFSRRRLLRSGIMISPLILSVKSPTAWAGLEGNCTSALISGNASQIDSCSSQPLSPGYWHSVLPANNSNKAKVETFIKDKCGVTPDTEFEEIFLTATTIDYFNSHLPTGWSISQASAPHKFSYIFGNGSDCKTAPIYITFKKGRREIGPIDITGEVSQVVRFLCAGYMNSLFHDMGVINYMSLQELDNLYSRTMIEVLNSIIERLSTPGTRVSHFDFDKSPLRNLVSTAELERW